MSNFIKEWTNKEVENLTRSFRRYSVFVFILKFILPLSALAMVVTLFIYPLLSNQEKKIRLVAQEQPAVTEKIAPVMTNPKFVGVDSKNQPYEIAAKRAVQEGDDIVLLEDVAGNITLIGDKWVSIVAKNGRYEAAKNYVELIGDVNVFSTDAAGETTQVTADDAKVDIKRGIVQSDNPIRIKSSTLDFAANNFILDKENEKITFQGGVKLIIIKQ